MTRRGGWLADWLPGVARAACQCDYCGRSVNAGAPIATNTGGLTCRRCIAAYPPLHRVVERRLVTSSASTTT